MPLAFLRGGYQCEYPACEIRLRGSRAAAVVAVVKSQLFGSARLA